MSKYAEFQQLFVKDGDSHLDQADLCFDAIDELTRQIQTDSDWHPDDIEYISLGQPVVGEKPARLMRFKRSGKNRERVREVATRVGNSWSLGIRLRLRPHVNVSFQPREAMFVLPVLATLEAEQVNLRVELEGVSYSSDQVGNLIELTFERIQKILELGIQTLIGNSHRPEELHDLGFVLNSETMAEMGIEEDSRNLASISQSPSSPPAESAVEPFSSADPSTNADSPLTQASLPSGRSHAKTTHGTTAKKTGRSRKTI